jgi:histidyl-tRNA synthetase
MSISKKPYKGCRDLFPELKRAQDYMFDKMKSAANAFGYEPYDGPMLEEVDLYRAKSGQELINDQIYSFMDRGEREVAIRPEMTPTVARMVAQVHREAPKPIRWYSIPNLMRYERPQRGRLREHWQFNVDLFGPESIYNEIEILQVITRLFNSLGANSTHFEILFNNRQFIDFFFSKTLGLDEDKSYDLYKLIDRAKKLPKEKFNEQLAAFNLETRNSELFNEYLTLKSIEEFKDFSEKISFPKENWDLGGFLSAGDAAGLSEYLVFDPTIVRGLDYYTGLVFEVFDKHPDNRRALCGGGSYAGLMKIFGEEQLPGVGFGLGDVTLKDFLESHGLLPDFSNGNNVLFLGTEDESCELEILNLANSIRSRDISVINSPSKLKFKKLLQQASKSGSRFLGIIQKETKKVKIKNLITNDQNVFELGNLKEIITELNK